MTTVVRVLKDTSFALKSKELVTLNYDDVILVFFDDHSDFADAIRPVFMDAAGKAAGVIYAICDVLVNDEIARAFTRVSNEPNNPHHWVGSQFPFILIYRDGWPQAFYNGPLDPEALRAYSVNTAGQPDYHEYDNSLYQNNMVQTPTSLPPGAPPVLTNTNVPAAPRFDTQQIPQQGLRTPVNPVITTTPQNMTMSNPNQIKRLGQ